MSSALVARGAYYGMRAYKKRKVMGRGMRAAAFMYRNRKPFMRMARAAKRMRTSRARVSSRRNIGEPPGTGVSKRAEVRDVQGLNLGTRVLYVRELTNIPHGANNDINTRQRNCVFYSGSKICMELRNADTDPQYINIAVISPKFGGAPTVDQFFRDSNLGRSIDFGIGLSSLDFHCKPINSDRFTILRHKRYRLQGTGSATYVENGGKNYMNTEFYVKVKRQLRYENNADTVPSTGGVYLVYWMDKFNTQAGIVGTSNASVASERIITYFKEPSVVTRY